MKIIYIRKRAMSELTGLPPTTLDDWIADGLFPTAINLGHRVKGHALHEVQAVHAARLAGRNDPEIRQLVLQLEAARPREWEQLQLPFTEALGMEEAEVA